jgi:hypothetical protein
MRQWWSFLMLFVATAAGAGQGVVIWYSEQEEGIEPYPVRYIVTEDYLRSDNGGSDEGFVLLDRNKKIIYNVVPSSATILVIDGSAGLATPPPSLRIDESGSDHEDAPAIAGHKAREVQVYAGERFCYGAVVVPGLDEAVGAALREFAHVLAARRAQTLDNTPPEMRDDCFLARYVYAPARHLAQGLPVEEWDVFGRRRRLAAPAEAIEVDDALFELPAEYRRY